MSIELDYLYCCLRRTGRRPPAVRPSVHHSLPSFRVGCLLLIRVFPSFLRPRRRHGSLWGHLRAVGTASPPLQSSVSRPLSRSAPHPGRSRRLAVASLRPAESPSRPAKIKQYYSLTYVKLNLNKKIIII